MDDGRHRNVCFIETIPYFKNRRQTMWNAVIVDRDYGSVSLENQKYIKEEYAKNGILHHAG